MYSGDEEFGDEITSGIFPDEPAPICDCCGAPCDFGADLCDSCAADVDREEQEQYETGADRTPPRE